MLFSIDTLRGAPGADGASSILLKIGIHPSGVRARYPAFAEYLEKYISPSRYRFVLRDRSGVRWLDVSAAKNVLTIRLRARDGRIAPLDGPSRPMPDTLRLDAELYAKFLFFEVGVSALRGDVIMLHSEHERGWLMRFHEEPDWHLPLAAARLIRTPLRRPFEQGVMLRLAIRDSAGGQTLITRRTRLVVQESAILRFLGSLGWTAMNDFSGTSEVEENRFSADAFGAMRADIRGLGPLRSPAVAAP
jgi:hypothetical protein